VNDLNPDNYKIKQSQFSPAGTCYSIFNSDLLNGSSIPVVFIHGVGLNQAVWEPQLDFFKEDHCLIAYDIYGHGNSSIPQANVTLGDYASQLEELLNHLKIPLVHVVGHSMGALIAISFTLNFPSRVLSTVPLNIVYKRTAIQSQAVLQRALDVIKSNQVSGIEAALERWFSQSNNPVYKEKVSKLRSWIEAVNPVGYGRTYSLFAKSDDEFDGRLEEINIPVLYLAGDEDTNSTPEMSKQMAIETPKGSSFVIENEAHMMAYISPEKVNPLINDFLVKTEQAASDEE
jgi:pimeloyl-ACP methyl ester carboxylesterase